MRKTYRFQMEIGEDNDLLKIFETRFESAGEAEISLMTNSTDPFVPEVKGVSIVKGHFQNNTAAKGLLCIFLYYYVYGDLEQSSLKGAKGTYAQAIAEAARVTKKDRQSGKKKWIESMFTLPSEDRDIFRTRIETEIRYTGLGSTARLTSFWKDCELVIKYNGVDINNAKALTFLGRFRDGKAIEFPDTSLLSNRETEFKDAKLNLPLYPEDYVQILIANQGSFHIYLIWISSEGEIEFLYPWESRHDIGSLPKPEKTTNSLRIPSEASKGLQVQSHFQGFETLITLCSRDPISAKRFQKLEIPQHFDSIPYRLTDPTYFVSLDTRGQAFRSANYRLGKEEEVGSPHGMVRLQEALQEIFQELGCDQVSIQSFANRSD